MKKTAVVITSAVFALMLTGCAPAGQDAQQNTQENKTTDTASVTGTLTVTPTQQKNGTMTMEPQTPPELTAQQQEQLKAGESAHEPTTLTFDVNGGNFYFTPTMIKVKKGDTVKIVFKNDGGMHNWVLDEFNVTMDPIKTDESSTVEFVADKVGTFEFYCSVGQHRQMGMKGMLVVEE